MDRGRQKGEKMKSNDENTIKRNETSRKEERRAIKPEDKGK